MVKYMEWGGESSGFCQAFPNTMSGSEKPVTFDVCRIIQSIARDCIKTTQDSEVTEEKVGLSSRPMAVNEWHYVVYTFIRGGCAT